MSSTWLKLCRLWQVLCLQKTFQTHACTAYICLATGKNTVSNDVIRAFHDPPVKYVIADSIVSLRHKQREITHNTVQTSRSLSPASTSTRPSFWLAAQRRALTGRWEQEADLCLRGNSGSPVFSCPPPTTSSCSPACLLQVLLPPLPVANKKWTLLHGENVLFTRTRVPSLSV